MALVNSCFPISADAAPLLSGGPNNLSVMGNANAAALVNQLAIECQLPNIRNDITSVSPLIVFQHDGKSFTAKGANNKYSTIAKPVSLHFLADAKHRTKNQ